MNACVTESPRLLMVTEVKEEELSASEDGSSVHKHLMAEELHDSDNNAVKIEPELPSGITDSLGSTVKTEDDDWDAKWRVDVPDRDPLELGPDTKVSLGDGVVKEESEAPIAAVGEGDQATSSTGGPAMVDCPHCGFSCLGQDRLNRHVKKKHSHIGRNGKLKCEWCQYSTNKSIDMNRHRRTHTGERPYRCNICDKTFTKQSNLTTHRRIHTGERPYNCDICGRTFSWQNALTRHRRIHTGERPYRCDICDKTFTVQSSLMNHLRLHTGERPYHCETCDKTFAVQGTLASHRRTHTGERPYHCDTCDKTFAVQSDLINHRRTHTGERPYHCETCDKTFARQGTLARHRRRCSLA
ncbi:zinc finger protein 525-like isoform X9 [Amphibalanus amphitrite]|uniref:zinc finger protein 525-like isoform X9 n=1 Tax=Amphibalanus amphitrite TaxID=1232801 RepID=UPI001C910E21|nr:zinc finger protein 525-like isoform X9 [Amphibalanus amphitrite]